jgi:polyamine oxidase
MAGIGASKSLSEAGIEHIILESSDRYGGRISHQKLAGEDVNLGAMFLHSQSPQGNLLLDFVQAEGIPTLPVSPEH